MDSFEVVTYFIAGLGVIVLSLCIVVAGILIYQYCRSVTGLIRDLHNSRLECLTVSDINTFYTNSEFFPLHHVISKHNNISISNRKGKRRYVQVETEEGGAVPSSYQRLTSPAASGPGQGDTLTTQDETDNKRFRKLNKKFPSVKMRLFRQNSAARRKSKIEFQAADFDVPPPKISRVKRVAFNTRISRSEWDIYDNRAGSEIRDEIEMLLTRNSKDLSIRSKSPEREEDFKSQYFDALETLSEDEEDSTITPLNDDDEYEDIEDEEDQVKTTKRHQKPTKQMNIRSLPKPVQRRVKAMKNLLVEQKKIEGEMFKDIHKLEGYFYKMHRNKNYNERQKLVEGELCQSTILEEEEEEGDEPRREMEMQGIPGFWLKVLLNSKNLSQIVQVGFTF